MYGPLFDGHNWATVVTSKEDWIIILTLVLLECILSVDNAIVLAAQTQKLPTKLEQEKSLFYGLWGAYIFRFILVGLGSYLINFWEIKVVGAVYLIYLSVRHFYEILRPERVHHKDKKKSLFAWMPLAGSYFN